ncbi:hypothetical protein LCGC14_2002600 [marine sediment metagenome]|uniref:Terminase small subunit n=1 Tax=marine sediment metagenome TaxID=412755 RepID=A0A0F9F2W4_9ZZZZ
MPSIKDESTDRRIKPARAHFCREYEINGHNAAGAYRIAYPNCKSGHRQAGGLLLTFADVKQEISRLEAKSVEKQEVTRQYCIDKLQAIAENGETERNKLTALSLLGDFTGAKRDKAPNQEKVAEMREHMDAEEIARRQDQAKRRTDELSGSNEPFPRIKTG